MGMTLEDVSHATSALMHPPMASEATDPDTPRVSCYICMESTPPLIQSPCVCRTMYMHPACQMRMVQHSGNPSCSVCATPFTNVQREHVQTGEISRCLIGHLIVLTIAFAFLCAQLSTMTEFPYTDGVIFVVINISVVCMLTLTYITDRCAHRHTVVSIHV